MVTTLRVVRPFGPYRIGNTITDPVLVAQYLNDPNVVQVQDAGTPAPTTAPTTASTTAPTTAPTTASTTAPTTAPTTASTPPPPPSPTPPGTVLSASNAAPAMNGTASAGTSPAYMRGDAVAPTDTSRYGADNPLGFQTAAQVGVSINARVTTLIGTATATLDTFGKVAAQFAADESGVATLVALVGGHTTLLAAQAPHIPAGPAGAANGAAVLGNDNKLPAAVLPIGPGGVPILDSAGKLPVAIIPSGSGGVGPTGPQGPAGVAGAIGPAGAAGLAGAAGAAGPVGSAGVAGAAGPQGPAGPVVAATASTLGGIKCGLGLLCASDGTASVDSVAPAALSGSPLGTDQVVIVRGSGSGAVSYLVPVSSLPSGSSAPSGSSGTSPSPTSTPSGASLTLTNATFGAAPAGFGQQLTGGSGTAPLSVPAGSSTLEFFFTAPPVASGSFHWLVQLKGAGANNNDGNVAGVATDGSGNFFVSGAAGNNSIGRLIADNARHHVAIVTDAAGGTFRAFYDGYLVGPMSIPGATPSATSLQITAAGAGWGTIDEVRVSSVARYSTQFTPPAGPFVTEAGTVVIYHLDGNGAAN